MVRAGYILRFLDQFPPALCRVLARKSRGTLPLSTREIARVSRLSHGEVNKLSRRLTWEKVECGTMQRFSLACGINLRSSKNLKAQLRYWRNSKMVHLRSGTAPQRRMLADLMRLCSRAKSGRPASPTIDGSSPGSGDGCVTPAPQPRTSLGQHTTAPLVSSVLQHTP